MGELLTEAQAQKFKELLRSYEPHTDFKQQFINANVGVIMGTAGSGKDTLRTELLNARPDRYVRILSDTTRPMRPHEHEGDEYHFIEVQAMREGLSKHTYLQGQVVHGQQVSAMPGNQFVYPASCTGLSILVVQTEAELFAIKPDLKSIFLVPPSLEVLVERLKLKRHLSQAEQERRLHSALKELEVALATPRYYCIISNSIPDVTGRAHNFLSTGNFDMQTDVEARTVIANVLQQLKSHLPS